MPNRVECREAAISRKLILDFAVRQLPVVFKGLFAGQAVRRIATVADLPADWANTRVRPREPAERVNDPGKSFNETTVLHFLTSQAPPAFVYERRALVPAILSSRFPRRLPIGAFARTISTTTWAMPEHLPICTLTPIAGTTCIIN